MAGGPARNIVILPPAPREYSVADQNAFRSLVERAMSTNYLVATHVATHYAGAVDEFSHSYLADLDSDDHTQYHTDARALTWLGTRSTTDLPEGTNLYYTDERVDDRVDALIQDVAGKLTWTYDDGLGTLTPVITYDSQYFSGTNWTDLTDAGVTTLHTHTLNSLANPDGDKTFNMTTRTLKFLWTNPSGNPLELEASGAYSGALLHIHQHTGNPSAGGHLMTVEWEDTDLEGTHWIGPNTTAHALESWVSGDTYDRFRVHIDGAMFWGAGSTDVDVNLYRSAANTLKTDDHLYVAGDLNVGEAFDSGARMMVARGLAGHAWAANARTVATFENSGSTGTAISIISKSTGNSVLFFGDEASEAIGQIAYRHPTNDFIFYINGGTRGTWTSTELTLSSSLTVTGLTTLNGDLLANNDIYRGSAVDRLVVSGGSTDSLGSRIILWGETHATNASDFGVYASGDAKLFYDHSAGSWAVTGSLSVSGVAFFSLTSVFSGTISASAGINLTASPNIWGASDAYLSLSGGTAGNGGNIQLYGQTHATKANDIEFATGGGIKLQWDDSAATWILSGASRPDVTNTRSLGTPSFRYATIYSTFINVSSTSTLADVTTSGSVTVGNNLTLTSGYLVIPDSDASVSSWSGSLRIGASGAGQMLLDANEIMAKTNDTTAGTLYLQHEGGTLQIFGSVAGTANINGSIVPMSDINKNIGSTTYAYSAVFSKHFVRGVAAGATDFVAFGSGVDSTTGANMIMYGPLHPTLAYDILFRKGATTKLSYDDSASLWTFATAVTISAGNLSFTAGGQSIAMGGGESAITDLKQITGRTSDGLLRLEAGSAAGNVYVNYGAGDTFNVYDGAANVLLSVVNSGTNPWQLNGVSGQTTAQLTLSTASGAIGEVANIAFQSGRATVGYDGATTMAYLASSASKSISLRPEGVEYVRLNYSTTRVEFPKQVDFQTTRAFIGNVAGSYGTFGTIGGGITAAVGSTQHTDAAALNYRAYLAYDAYWDDSTDSWTAVRTDIGRKWMIDMGYHNNTFRVRTFDGTVSSPWADSAWTNLFTVNTVGAGLLYGSAARLELNSTSSNPILEFDESSTRRAYVAYNFTSNYLDITAEEGSSSIRLRPSSTEVLRLEATNITAYSKITFNAGVTSWINGQGTYGDLIQESAYGTSTWGMRNASYTHFYTDGTAGFYFAKHVAIDGQLFPYDGAFYPSSSPDHQDVTGTVTIDWNNNQVQTVSMGAGSLTVQVDSSSNMNVGATYTLHVHGPSTGSQNLTISGANKWVGGDWSSATALAAGDSVIVTFQKHRNRADSGNRVLAVVTVNGEVL